MNSPCQNGIRAGAPGAGTTITRSCSIARIRQVERSELEGVTNARLVHELLVEFSEACLVGEVDRIKTTVGNGAAGDRCNHPRRACWSQHVTDRGPTNTRASSSETTSPGYLPASIASVSSNAPRREFVVRICADARTRTAPLQSSRRSDATMATMSLRQHVECVLHHACRLDVARRPCRRRIASCSSASSRKVGMNTPRLTASSECPARPTRCSADATRLGLCSCTTRSTRSHVDPEFQRTGGDERAEFARLEPLLQHEAPLARQ